MGSPRSPVIKDDDDDDEEEDDDDGDADSDDDDGDGDDDKDNLKANSWNIGHSCRLRNHRVVGNLLSLLPQLPYISFRETDFSPQDPLRQSC